MERNQHTPRRRMGRRLVLAAVAVAGLTPVLGGAAQAAVAPPEPTNCTVIDYESAKVTPLPSAATAGTNRLTVTGQLPATNYAVELRPVIYIQQPDYWQIDVVRCQTGDFGATVITPFTATFDFVGSLGTCGIDVQGATRHDRFDLAGCQPQYGNPLANTNWRLVPSSLGVPVPAGRTITANFGPDRVGGNSGCNLYSGPYAVSGKAIKVGSFITTKIACDPVATKAESTYLRKLGSAQSFSVSGGVLTISGPAGSLLFRSGAVITP